MKTATFLLLAHFSFSYLASFAAAAQDGLFESNVLPIIRGRCLHCHSGDTPDGDLSLDSSAFLHGTDVSSIVVSGDPESSLLIQVISGDDPRMPEDGDPLSPEEVQAFRDWVAAGAVWPSGLQISSDADQWWSLQPLRRADIPSVGNANLNAAEQGSIHHWARSPIDAFVLARLRESGLEPSVDAEKRMLIRRLYYDLHGLPPSPGEVEEFVNDDHPMAYEKLVDRLLSSPRYGERWARHWLDIAHYADTHGYDKDKVREHAWPFRDYVIDALNVDKAYSEFISDQVAGDILSDKEWEGVPAVGFLAAGPFDWVGQVEVSEQTMEGKRVRNLDRDDMVATVMNSFASVTAQCARCHNHKFDPISQADYYSLQAIFAAVDRADRPYNAQQEFGDRLGELEAELDITKRQIADIKSQLEGEFEIQGLMTEVERLRNSGEKLPDAAEFGYHSGISSQQDVVKWVQIDLGNQHSIDKVLIFPCYDDFNGIGEGFGFPPRYRIDASNDPLFEQGVVNVVDHSLLGVPNPGVKPLGFDASGLNARYLRLTATQLAERQRDYIFALGEAMVFDAEGRNLAANASVSALDSIEAPVRWGAQNLVDGKHFGQHVGTDYFELCRAIVTGTERWQVAADSDIGRQLIELEARERDLQDELERVTKPQIVYAVATDFESQGNFRATAGKAREIFVLKRGDERYPDIERGEMSPGALSVLSELDCYFEPLTHESTDGERRTALAHWLADHRNPLVWRSIVNRVWQYHLGCGIVDTPNDFGKMGELPSHPALLDFLAIYLQDSGESLKGLHRMICSSSVYRQAVTVNKEAERVDAENRLLWRGNRRRLDAESIRDSILQVAGRLELSMGGPGFRAFQFEDDHSPRYLYTLHNPNDTKTSRRSVYRFTVRSVPDPLMTALDCADPTISVPIRSETLTSLQALAMLNDRFVTQMAEHFASSIERDYEDEAAQVQTAFEQSIGREPSVEELNMLIQLRKSQGLPSVCRVIFNLNEFVFVD